VNKTGSQGDRSSGYSSQFIQRAAVITTLNSQTCRKEAAKFCSHSGVATVSAEAAELMTAYTMLLLDVHAYTIITAGGVTTIIAIWRSWWGPSVKHRLRLMGNHGH